MHTNHLNTQPPNTHLAHLSSTHYLTHGPGERAGKSSDASAITTHFHHANKQMLPLVMYKDRKHCRCLPCYLSIYLLSLLFASSLPFRTCQLFLFLVFFHFSLMLFPRDSSTSTPSFPVQSPNTRVNTGFHSLIRGTPQTPPLSYVPSTQDFLLLYLLLLFLSHFPMQELTQIFTLIRATALIRSSLSFFPSTQDLLLLNFSPLYLRDVPVKELPKFSLSHPWNNSDSS